MIYIIVYVVLNILIYNIVVMYGNVDFKDSDRDTSTKRIGITIFLTISSMFLVLPLLVCVYMWMFYKDLKAKR